MKPDQPKKPRFEVDLPEGLEVPDDLEDDGEFDVVATLRKKGKTFCVVEMNGLPMPGYDEAKNADERAGESQDDADMQGMSTGRRVREKAMRMKGDYQ